MKRTIWIPAALTLLLGSIGQIQADFSYDTTGSWNGSSSIQPFGSPNTSTYGQTFVAPSAPNDSLKSFTFYIEGDSSVHLSMKAYVFAWSGAMTGGNPPQGATGPALYSSPSSISYNGDGTFQAVTVNTGGTALTPGGHYVALLTISNPTDYANSFGTTVWGDTFTHSANNGGGGFNFYNNGAVFAALNSTPWDDFADFGDLAWKADFGPGGNNVVPEPASLTLLGIGLVCVGGFARRRRNRVSE